MVSPVPTFLSPTTAQMSPGENFLDVFPLIGVHLEQAANSLMLLRTRVHHRLARLQLSRVHPDKRQLTDKRVGHDLEGQRRERLFVVGLARDRLPIVGIEAMRLFRVERRGQVIHHRIQQRLDTFILERRSHHHRKQLQPDRGLAQRRLQLVRRNRFAFQKLVQNVVIILGDGFDQLRMERLSLFLQFRGNLGGLVLRAYGLVFPDDGLHGDQVHHSAKLVFLSDGNLNRDRLGVEPLAEGIDGMLEIRTHLVDLVNETNSRNAVLVRLPPYFFRLRLHAVHRVKHRHRAVQHAQRALHLGRKVHVAGRIDNVDADVAPGAGRRRRRNRDAALLLLLHPVHDGRAFMHLADTVRLSRIKQDALRRRGLPGIDVGHDADVPATL